MKKIINLLAIIIMVVAIPIRLYADETQEEMNEQEAREDILQVSGEVTKEPQIHSRAVLILDTKSNTVIYEKNGYSKRAMASTTKIMTCIVVLENAKLTDTVEISKKAGGTGGSRLGLKAGDKVTVQDLLYGLMLRSGNDAAVALAEYVGGSVEGFAKLMNQKAKELNLTNTNFVTPHGLDSEEHYTTAYELALLTNYALKNKKFAAIVNTKTGTIAINGQARVISNTNELLGNLWGVDGVKTGFTNNAGRCLVTSTTREGNQIICVVLGADTKKIRTQDSVKLIEYAFKNYQYINIKEKVEQYFKEWQEEKIKKIEIIKGCSSYPKVELEAIPYEQIPVKIEEIKNLQIQTEVQEQLQAPIQEQYQIGTLKVKIKEKEILKLKITIKENIEKKTINNYMLEFLQKHLPNLLINSLV